MIPIYKGIIIIKASAQFQSSHISNVWYSRVTGLEIKIRTLLPGESTVLAATSWRFLLQMHHIW